MGVFYKMRYAAARTCRRICSVVALNLDRRTSFSISNCAFWQ
jgi:hypothetical protein